jgi:hypothetical protein
MTNGELVPGVGGPRGEAEVAAAAFGVDSIPDGERFGDGRFSHSIFANQKSDFGVELQPIETGDRRNGKRVLQKTRDRFALEANRPDVS